MINFNSKNIEVIYRNSQVVFFKIYTNGKITHKRSNYNGKRLTKTSTLNKFQFNKDIEFYKLNLSVTQSNMKHL